MAKLFGIRTKKVSIVARLIASFSLIIVIFIVYVLFSTMHTARIDRMHRHNNDFNRARTEMLLSYHQIFTEARWLLETTFIDEAWRQSADEAAWRRIERDITFFYIQLLGLGTDYLNSVREDPIIPHCDDDLRIRVMSETMEMVSMIHEAFRDNFFRVGTLSFELEELPDYVAIAEQNLQVLRQIAVVNMAVADGDIADLHNFLNAVSIIVVIGIVILAGILTLLLMQSISAIRELQEREKKMLISEENSRAKTKFLATMSHEIRTPITAVLGIAEIQLQNPSLALDIEEAFAKIHDSAGILLNIINDILDISKIEAGKMDLIISKYEVISLNIDIIQFFSVYMDNDRIEFEATMDETMPVYLIGDELRIKQIISNVLSNAFKYTSNGKVVFGMHCEYSEAGCADMAPATLVISVSDTGRGMTKEQIQALHDDYTRFHEQEARFIQGTGLGMPIVYNLTHLMGGEIHVKSEVGKGTTVTMRLPQTVSGTEQVGRETVNNLRYIEAGMLKKKPAYVLEQMPYGNVLVVDDIETNLYVAKGLLSLYGLKIDAVSSGISAINKIKQGNVYDIIFMDFMMPEINGMEATKIMRELGYNQPIVALTANALIGQAEEFLKNGFDGFIAKPIQSAHLNAILNKFIRDKQPPEVLARFKPVAGSGADDFMAKSDTKEKLRKDFGRIQQNMFGEISAALESGNLKAAHRLSHNLKSMAALIDERDLSQIAADFEDLLKQGTTPCAEQLEVLKAELARVLKDIGPTVEIRAQATVLDKQSAKRIFDKLLPMLEKRSFECLGVLEELRGVPNSEALSKYIENFDFVAALRSLNELKVTLGIE